MVTLSGADVSIWGVFLPVIYFTYRGSTAETSGCFFSHHGFWSYVSIVYDFMETLVVKCCQTTGGSLGTQRPDRVSQLLRKDHCEDMKIAVLVLRFCGLNI